MATGVAGGTAAEAARLETQRVQQAGKWEEEERGKAAAAERREVDLVGGLEVAYGRGAARAQAAPGECRPGKC